MKRTLLHGSRTIVLITMVVVFAPMVGATSGTPSAAHGRMAMGTTATPPTVQSVTNSFTPLGHAAYLSEGETATLSGLSFGTTPGTVEIGISPYYPQAAPVIRQTVTAWSDTAVTFKAILTGLPHGDRRFVFVKDSAGSASMGVPVYGQVTAPNVTSVTSSGSFSTQGSTLTITGTGFRTRNDYHTDTNKLALFVADFNDDTNLVTNPYKNLAASNVTSAMTVSSANPRTTIPNDRFYRRTGGDAETGIPGNVSVERRAMALLRAVVAPQCDVGGDMYG